VLTECATEFAKGMALTIRSCKRFPIDLFGPQARLDVPDLVAQVALLERSEIAFCEQELVG
jgi:hypothetical protein